MALGSGGGGLKSGGAGGGTAFDGALTGNLSVTGTTDLRGTISNSTGDVTVGDNLVVTGTTDLRGNVSNSTGTLTFADAVAITGTLDVQGVISNSTGNVAITDVLDVTGATNITGATSITGLLTMTGSVQPEANGTRSLGSASLRWNGIYFNNLIGSSGNPRLVVGSAVTNTYTTEATNSGSNVGHIFNNTISLAGATSLATFRNNSTDKLGIHNSGKFVYPASGAADVRGTATLVGGTKTVTTTSVRTGDIIMVSRNTPGGAVGDLSAPVASIVDATSFVINSASGTDTSTINWWILT